MGASVGEGEGRGVGGRGAQEGNLGVPEAVVEGEMTKKCVLLISSFVGFVVGFAVMFCSLMFFSDIWGFAIGLLGCIVSGFLIGWLNDREETLRKVESHGN